jgi:hypothetical protein
LYDGLMFISGLWNRKWDKTEDLVKYNDLIVILLVTGDPAYDSLDQIWQSQRVPDE